MQQLANTATTTLTTIDDLAVQAQMFSCGAAMNLLQLGRVLTEAKPLVPHGAWAEWVETNAHLPERRAQEYMQCYRKFGLDQRIAQLGTSQIIALLPMTDSERESLMSREDIGQMNNRELKAAIREEREKARREALAEAEEAIAQAEERARQAESQAKLHRMREAKIPDSVAKEIEETRKQLTIAKQNAERFQDMVGKANELRVDAERRAEKMARELSEAEETLNEQQEALNQAQEELLNLQSAPARGDAAHDNASELTLEVFGAAVREFVGTCARMPYMAGSFAAMPTREKNGYDELLRTMEGWCGKARQAMSSVAVEGGLVIG